MATYQKLGRAGPRSIRCTVSPADLVQAILCACLLLLSQPILAQAQLEPSDDELWDAIGGSNTALQIVDDTLLVASGARVLAYGLTADREIGALKATIEFPDVVQAMDADGNDVAFVAVGRYGICGIDLREEPIQRAGCVPAAGPAMDIAVQGDRIAFAMGTEGLGMARSVGATIRDMRGIATEQDVLQVDLSQSRLVTMAERSFTVFEPDGRPLGTYRTRWPLDFTAIAVAGASVYIGQSGQVERFDISDPNTPVAVASTALQITGGSPVSQIEVTGSTLWASTYSSAELGSGDGAIWRVDILDGSLGDAEFTMSNERVASFAVLREDRLAVAIDGIGFGLFEILEDRVELDPLFDLGSPVIDVAQGSKTIFTAGSTGFTARRAPSLETRARTSYQGATAVDVIAELPAGGIEVCIAWDQGTDRGELSVMRIEDPVVAIASSIVETSISDIVCHSERIVAAEHQIWEDTARLGAYRVQADSSIEPVAGVAAPSWRGFERLRGEGGRLLAAAGTAGLWLLDAGDIDDPRKIVFPGESVVDGHIEGRSLYAATYAARAGRSRVVGLADDAGPEPSWERVLEGQVTAIDVRSDELVAAGLLHRGNTPNTSLDDANRIVLWQRTGDEPEHYADLLLPGRIHDIHLDPDRAYVAAGDAGLVVIDLDNLPWRNAAPIYLPLLVQTDGR